MVDVTPVGTVAGKIVAFISIQLLLEHRYLETEG
jgi:hypothetical protein